MKSEDLDSGRCLSVAYSHSLIGNTKNALALFSRALKLALRTRPDKPNESIFGDKPPNLDVSSEQSASLQKLLESLVLQHQALLELHSLSSDIKKTAKLRDQGAIPLIERLDEYPVNGADLSKLVIYPPRLRPIPVKPLFLDVAWNYIEYPGGLSKPKQEVNANGVPQSQEPAERSQGRRGWFGFGR